MATAITLKNTTASPIILKTLGGKSVPQNNGTLVVVPDLVSESEMCHSYSDEIQAYITAGSLVLVVDGVEQTPEQAGQWMDPASKFEIMEAAGEKGWIGTISCGDTGKDFVSTRRTVWKSVRSFTFPGTDNMHRLPECAEFIIYTDSGSNYAQCRLYDVTNNNQIAYAESNSINDDNLETDNALTNLPAGKAVMELQIRRAAGDFVRARTKGVSIF